MLPSITCSLLTDVQLFHRGKKSVTERHEVTLPSLMQKIYDEKEILLKDQIPSFQLLLTDLALESGLSPSPTQCLSEGRK